MSTYTDTQFLHASAIAHYEQAKRLQPHRTQESLIVIAAHETADELHPDDWSGQWGITYDAAKLYLGEVYGR